jgi:hypothetical protein
LLLIVKEVTRLQDLYIILKVDLVYESWSSKESLMWLVVNTHTLCTWVLKSKA